MIYGIKWVAMIVVILFLGVAVAPSINADFKDNLKLNVNSPLFSIRSKSVISNYGHYVKCSYMKDDLVIDISFHKDQYIGFKVGKLRRWVNFLDIELENEGRGLLQFYSNRYNIVGNIQLEKFSDKFGDIVHIPRGHNLSIKITYSGVIEGFGCIIYKIIEAIRFVFFDYIYYSHN
jgi:hypothetical protein